MKKYLFFLCAAALAVLAISCDPKTPKPVDITVQLMADGTAFAQEGVTVALADAAGTANYEALTDASGAAAFTVPIGSYTASATWKTYLSQSDDMAEQHAPAMAHHTARFRRKSIPS